MTVETDTSGWWERTLVDADHPAGQAQAARAVLDQLPVMVVGFEVPDHRFVVTNAAMRAFTQGRPMLGLPVREAFPDVGWGTMQEFFIDGTGIPNRAEDGTVVGVIT